LPYLDNLNPAPRFVLFGAAKEQRPRYLKPGPSSFWLPIPPKLDSHSSANWTPDPPQAGRLFQRKLDSRSEATHGVDAVYALRVTSVNVGLSRHG
jgi:hypothetical protein